MADVIFNVAKGRIAAYADLPNANDGLIAVVLELAGLESDAAIVDHDTLAAVLAGTSNEQLTMGRKPLTGVVPSVDDANDRVLVDCDDIVWTAAGGNPTGALLICYDPDTTVTDDTTVVPLAKYDFAVTPSGGDITAQIDTLGFYQAS